jgi:hypothetical protein
MSDDVLTPTEIWLRICHPHKFQQAVVERTEALSHPGREKDLQQWLAIRATADAEWENREAIFRAEVFAKFVKELGQGPFPAQEPSLNKPVNTPLPDDSNMPSEEEKEFAEVQERIARALIDPQVFDEIMAENKRLNALEAAARQADPLPLKDLGVSPAMNHLVEEFRTIIRVEGLDAREAAEQLTTLLREEIELSTDDIELLDPRHHYPADATEEQRTHWHHQENDPRQVEVAKEVREEKAHIELPRRHAFPPMSAEARQELVEQASQATQSLSVKIAPTQDPPKLKL